MNPITDTINKLTRDVLDRQETLDNALFVMQTWISRNAPILDDNARSGFSQTLANEKTAPAPDGVPYGDDQSLVASTLRLHTMRLLYRYDHDHDGGLAEVLPDDNPYRHGTYRLREALRSCERAINEARVDAAIANAHQIMGDTGANHRWLQDALAHLQAAAKLDLVRLVESVPPPPMPELNFFQRATFFVLGIKPAEIARRNLKSLRQLADLQTAQLIEMAQLLVTSFETINDQPGIAQATMLIRKFTSAHDPVPTT